MKIGFDLDGVLDRPAMAQLALALLKEGYHQVYIITGVFPEALGWQDHAAKRRKMERIGIPYDERGGGGPGVAQLYILTAVPSTFDRDYRLADLGLRKGALCEELGIQMFFDDSELYCEMIPKMSGATIVLHVS